MNTGGCSHKPACRRSMGKWLLFFLNPRATGEFSSTCGRLGSLFRTALPTLAWGRGLEKVLQTNACSSSVWSAYHSRTTMQKGKHKRIILGAWNVRNLLNRAITLRPERGTALVARELQHYRVDIAALSETWIPDKGSLREEGGDYTFWKEKPQAEVWIHSVGFAIRTALLRSMPVQPVGINKCTWNCTSLSAGSDTSQLSALTPLHLQAQMTHFMSRVLQLRRVFSNKIYLKLPL